MVNDEQLLAFNMMFLLVLIHCSCGNKSIEGNWKHQGMLLASLLMTRCWIVNQFSQKLKRKKTIFQEGIDFTIQLGH